MNKLFKLREWVTIAEAAEYLRIILGEPVADHDVLRLGLDHHLALSVIFVGHAIGRRGRTVPLNEAEVRVIGNGRTFKIKALPELNSEEIHDGLNSGELQKIHSDVLYPQTRTLFSQALRRSFRDDAEPVIEFDNSFSDVEGICDLPLVGGERIDLELKYLSMTGGAIPANVAREPIIVIKWDADFEKNDFYRLSKRKLPVDMESPGTWHDPEFYDSVCSLPDNSQLVVRTSALRDFENKIVTHTNIGSDATTLKKKERNNLYSIVGALLQTVGIKQEALIADLIKRNPGASGFSKRNLEDVFAEANRAIKGD